MRFTLPPRVRLLTVFALSACSSSQEPNGDNLAERGTTTASTTGAGTSGSNTLATTSSTSGTGTATTGGMAGSGGGSPGGTTTGAGTTAANTSGGLTTTGGDVGGAGGMGGTAGTSGVQTTGMVLTGPLPPVYEEENTGLDCAVATSFPAFSELPSIPEFPDPFLMESGDRITSRADWRCRRAEISAQIQQWELGTKPPPAESEVTATYSGGTLTVNVSVGGQSITLSTTINLPGSGSAPYPALIQMDGSGVPANIFTSRGVATMRFTSSTLASQFPTRGQGPFWDLFPDNTVGSYAGWAWGVSRIIDGLQLTADQHEIDTKRLAVSGCSYAGKMALWAGAFDERIALTIPEESGGGRRVGRIHRLAASAQAGVTLVLLVTSGLFLRSLGVMAERDFGFEPQGLLTVGMDVHQEGYESQDVAEPFLEEVRGALEEIPGVASVSVADGIPLDLVGNFTSVSRADLPEEEAGSVQVEFTRVGESYFETIGTPVLRGRGIERTDDSSSEPVVVLTESLAARLWPGEEVLGRQVRSAVVRGGPEVFTVVGVVPEVASSRSTESWPNIFVAARQSYRSRIMLVIRGTGDLATLTRPIQSAILGVDPGLSFPTVVSSESLVAQSTQAQRSSAGIAGAMGLLALLLSAIGVYGVVAFAVTSRTREIGLRMAVGASRHKVLRGVLWDAVRLAAPGLAGGAVLSAAAAAGFRSELFGLSPLDPVSFGAAAGLLFLVILFASVVPARRASGIDPMEALRSE